MCVCVCVCVCVCTCAYAYTHIQILWSYERVQVKKIEEMNIPFLCCNTGFSGLYIMFLRIEVSLFSVWLKLSDATFLFICLGDSICYCCHDFKYFLLYRIGYLYWIVLIYLCVQVYFQTHLQRERWMADYYYDCIKNKLISSFKLNLSVLLLWS